MKKNVTNELEVTIDEEPWYSTAALKPEDEILVRQLNDLMKTTSEGLSKLSKKFKYFKNTNQKTSNEETEYTSSSSEIQTKFKTKSKRSVSKNQKNCAVQTNDCKVDERKSNQVPDSHVFRLGSHVLLEEETEKKTKNVAKINKQQLVIQPLPPIKINKVLLKQAVAQISIPPREHFVIDNGQTASNTAVIELCYENVPTSKTEGKERRLNNNLSKHRPTPRAAELSVTKLNLSPRSKQNNVKAQMLKTKGAKLTHKSECKLKFKDHHVSKSPKTAQFKSQENTEESNPADYLPYSKLTLGGVDVSDIENEIRDSDYDPDLPLSDIVDKILSSRESSNQVTPRINNNSKILAVSNPNNDMKDQSSRDVLDVNRIRNSLKTLTELGEQKSDHTLNEPEENVCVKQNHDTIYNFPSSSKKKSLSNLQKSHSVFEFIHTKGATDTATQVSPVNSDQKQTQTSPPLNNQVVPNESKEDKSEAIDRKFIRNFILEEFGDLNELQKNLAKISDTSCEINVSVQPKNTQTTPVKMKDVTTSPKKDSDSFETEAEPSQLQLKSEDSECVDIGISINVSSPRFKLVLPKSSHDVLSHFDNNFRAELETVEKSIQAHLSSVSSSTDTAESENDNDFRSLGEVDIDKFIAEYFPPSIFTTNSDTECHNKHSEKRTDQCHSKSEGELDFKACRNK